MILMLRLTLALFSLFLSLPLLITFHSLFMWKATLLVGEYGHRLAVLTLLLAVWCWYGNKVVLSALSVLSSAVLLSPLITAVWMSWQLPASLASAFGAKPDGVVLSLKDLWLGFGAEPTEPREFLLPNDKVQSPRRLFFYPAHSDKPAPVVLVIHGGGWQSGSAEEFPEWNSQWAAEGYAVASVEYRLAPQWTWPAPLDDVRDALTYLQAHARELHIDAQRVVLLGRSAGGQIATAAAVQLRDPAIRGVVSLYAPADMVFASRFADPKDVLDSPKLLGQYMGGKPDQVPEAYRTASATLTADVACPPMLMIHGQRDILVWHLQSRRLAEHLLQQGVPHFFLDLPWATHGLDYPLYGPGSQLTRYSIRVFLKNCLNP